MGEMANLPEAEGASAVPGASLRSVAAWLTLLAFLPVIALAAWAWSGEHARSLQDSEGAQRALTTRIASDQRRAVEGVRQLLGTVAAAPVVLRGDWEACRDFLRSLGTRFPQYGAIGVADPEGQVHCSSFKEARPVNLSQEPGFARSLRSRDFSGGGYTIGRMSGLRTLPFAMPVLSASGAVEGLAFAGADLALVERQLRALDVPDGTSALLADESGLVLAASGSDAHTPGTAPTDPGLAQALREGRTGVVRTTPAGGRPTRHIVEAIPFAGGGRMMVATSAPEDAASSPLLRQSVATGVALLVLLISYLWVTAALARRWLIAPLRALARDLRQVEIGSYRPQPRRRGEGAFVSEIETVRRALDAMSRGLRHRAAERDTAVQASAAAHAELRSVLDNMDDGFLVLDGDGHVKLANRRAAELMLREPAELPGSEFWTLMPGVWGARQRRRCETELARAHSWIFEAEDEERGRWLELRFFAADGNVGVFVQDNTERWEMMEELVEREKRYRELFEANANMMVIIDSQTLELLAVNAAAEERYGYSGEEFIGMPAVALAQPEDREAVREHLARDAAPGATPDEPRIWRHRTALGEPMLVEVVRSPVTFNGRPALLAMITEVTRRMASQSKLREDLARAHAEAERTATALSAYAHMARGYVGLLTEEVLPVLERVERVGTLADNGHFDSAPPEVRSYMTQLARRTRRTESLLREVLRLAQISRADFTPKQVDVTKMCEAVVGRLRDSSPGRDVQVEIQPGMVTQADPGLLRLLLVALLSNAWKFTSRRTGAWIRVGVTRSGPGGVPAFFVSDNGMGFDPQLGERIFHPFERGHAQGEFEGHGIGLAIARAVAVRHGGRVWGESHPGLGATFQFELQPRQLPSGVLVTQVVVDSLPSEPEHDSSGYADSGQAGESLGAG